MRLYTININSTNKIHIPDQYLAGELRGGVLQQTKLQDMFAKGDQTRIAKADGTSEARK